MAGPLSQIPMNVHPVPKADNTVAEQFIQQIDGETTFDRVAKAQSSMPQIVKRVTELENCLWALAEELSRRARSAEPASGMRKAAAEEQAGDSGF